MMARCFKYLAILVLACGASGFSADSVTINLAGKSGRFDVVKMGKSGIVLKADGKEQTVPMQVLTPSEVLDCYKQIDEKDKTAQLRLDVGNYLFKNKLYKEAAEELTLVMADEKLRPAAGTLLVQIAEKLGKAVPKVPETPAASDSKVAEKKDDKKDDKKDEKKPKKIEITSGSDDDIAAMQRAAMEEWKNQRQNVPEKTKEEVAEFLKTREAELNKVVGGTWRLIETKHFYCFANIAEAKHKKISSEWLEMPRQGDGSIGIYALLCEVLMHKDGDKLWNNKCPIYFFESYSQFQTFAAQIDKSPGAGYSGGYFMHRGRDVHICIPFMTQRLGEKAADRQAKSTLYHEGTHAFLQLSGEDVDLSRWLHEGLAQFIEFWFDSKNNPERAQRTDSLNRQIRAGDIPSWTAMKERPMGGGDTDGYAWAWLKFEFLYRNFNNQNVPKMIQLIKSGKTEEESIEKIFGASPDKLEERFKLWIKDRKIWDKPN